MQHQVRNTDVQIITAGMDVAVPPVALIRQIEKVARDAARYSDVKPGT